MRSQSTPAPVRPGPSRAKAEAIGGRAYFLERLDSFLDRVNGQPRPRMLVGDLVPEDGVTLFHGQPRDGKTVAMLEVLLAMATGTPAFGLERLEVPEKMPVCYVTEEDSERRTFERLSWLLNGRKASPFVELHLAVRRGVDLDHPEWWGALAEAANREGFKFLALDPLRSLTSCADQGPADLKPFVASVRKFMTETGCAVGVVHHDTKPLVGKLDDRKRPQRASGGGIFSVADAPVSFERIAEGRFLVAPTAYKFSDDPRPFAFRIEADSLARRMRLVGEDVDVGSAELVALHERILDFLRNSPGSSGNAIAKGIRAGKEATLAALAKLCEADRVDAVEARRGTQWFVRSAP